MTENEESKIKIYVKKFKQLWKNKRYRSLFILLIYFIFFMILFSILDFSSDNINLNNEKAFSFKDYEVYDFNIQLDINTVVYNFNGKRNQDQYEFTYDNQSFNMNYNELKQSNLDINIINSFEFTPMLINNMLENSLFLSEKKIVATNEIVKEYSLDLSKYLQILDYNLDIYNHDDTIIITMTNLNNQVTSITLDLTSFYKNLEEAYQEYKITINYSNLNN